MISIYTIVKNVYASFNGSTASDAFGSIGLAALADPNAVLESAVAPKSNSTSSTPPPLVTSTKSGAVLSIVSGREGGLSIVISILVGFVGMI